MRQVHIRVDDELYNELNSYSEKNELSMQDCVREAVAYYMSDVKRRRIQEKRKNLHLLIFLPGLVVCVLHLTGPAVNVFIRVNGTNTVSRPILQILENSRKGILQKLMLQIFRIMTFWLPDFRVSLFQ